MKEEEKKKRCRKVAVHLDIDLHEIIKGMTYSFNPVKTQSEVIYDLITIALTELNKRQKEDIRNMQNVHEDVKWISSISDDLRAQIEDLKKFSQEVIKEANSLTFPGVDEGEIRANLKLAYRHLEDARMRFGKVMQAAQGGTSIFNKKEEAPGLGEKPESLSDQAQSATPTSSQLDEPPIAEPISESAEEPVGGVGTSLSDSLKEEEVVVDPIETQPEQPEAEDSPVEAQCKPAVEQPVLGEPCDPECEAEQEKCRACNEAEQEKCRACNEVEQEVSGLGLAEEPVEEAQGQPYDPDTELKA